MTKNNLFKRAFRLKESDCTIISDREDGIETAKSSIKRNRRLLEEYIKDHPQFLHSLEPVAVDDGPEVARLMAEASLKADVGPMAAVAGVLADIAVQDMVKSGCKVAVVEDGGEVSTVSDQPIDIAFVAGDESLSREMGFRLKTFPVGVATSSGRFSHAFSFGDAEAVTVFAVDAGLADAAATAVANLIKGDDVRGVIRQGIDKALRIDGVNGIFILYRDVVGKAGQVPELLALK
ncbi:UPF0280 family protein [Candidatus Bathyarchaeota archaeon]|nr:UPF0280 family protein [Candidatus Bathyarchaeota archaeon]